MNKKQKQALKNALWAGAGALVVYIGTVLVPLFQDYLVSWRDNTGIHIRDTYFPTPYDGSNQWYQPPPLIAQVLEFKDLQRLTGGNIEEFRPAPPWTELCARLSPEYAEYVPLAPTMHERLRAAGRTIKELGSIENFLEHAWFRPVVYGDDPADQPRDPDTLRNDLERAAYVLQSFDFERPTIAQYPKWRIAIENRASRPFYLRTLQIRKLDSWGLEQGGGDDYGHSVPVLKVAGTAVVDLEQWQTQETGNEWHERDLATAILDQPILIPAEQTVLVDISLQKSTPNGSKTLYLAEVVIEHDDAEIKSIPFCFELP